VPSLTTLASACRTSSTSGGRRASQRNAAWALRTVAANGLLHFMGDRTREPPHGGDTVCVRHLHLHLAVSPLALAGFGFDSLSLGQIEHESDALALVPIPLEPRRADQHGYSAAVLAEVLLFEWLRAPGQSQRSSVASACRSCHSGGV
jgi:hypothetical protein